MLTYEQARQTVIEQVRSRKRPPTVEPRSVWDALGFVLAQEIKADRDYPPFDRSTRDGFAVSATDAVPGANLPCVREIKAGDSVAEPLRTGTCVQIMTGAAVPSGADAVVMIEHTHPAAVEGVGVPEAVRFDRPTAAGQNIVPRGSEGKAGQTVLPIGTRLGYAELALAAQVGAVELECAKKPRVAILSTGDEVVAVEETPGPFQIRNSNSVSLAAQVRLAGGEPVLLGNAADRPADLRAKIDLGLKEDVLVLSGGVSMGKYDLVETVLREAGAEFYFDAVAIRPGKPAVFGRCGDRFVFGLPGNPVSTMVTFELFVRPALDLLGGMEARPLPLLEATLAESVSENPNLTHFLPARVEWEGSAALVRGLSWRGSGDIVTLAAANCFLVIPEGRGKVGAGARVLVLMRRDVL